MEFRKGNQAMAASTSRTRWIAAKAVGHRAKRKEMTRHAEAKRRPPERIMADNCHGMCSRTTRSRPIRVHDGDTRSSRTARRGNQRITAQEGTVQPRTRHSSRNAPGECSRRNDTCNSTNHETMAKQLRKRGDCGGIAFNDDQCRSLQRNDRCIRESA